MSTKTTGKLTPGLFFRKKSPLTDWGLPFVRGAEEHKYLARRNTTGHAAASAQLVRALVAAISGHVTAIAVSQIQFFTDGDVQTGLSATVRRHSAPSRTATAWLTEGARWGVPHAGASYYVGLLAILDAMAEVAIKGPEDDNPVWDFWSAYYRLLVEYERYGKSENIKPALLLAADELYHWLVYRDSPAGHLVTRLGDIYLMDAGAAVTSPTGEYLSANALQISKSLKTLLRDGPLTFENAPEGEAEDSPENSFRGFVGPQGPLLWDAVSAGDNCLLAGPTGTGKTFLTEQVALEGEYTLVTINGMEGMIDLDIIGAILPQEDGSRKWVDGPLVRAMRAAQYDPVLLFIDEMNRIPREQVNLFVGMMNPKSREICDREGIPVRGEGPFYTLAIPMTGEIVWCPAKHLRIVAAGNFGSQYAVYELDPALRRRFETVIEFEYPEAELELHLVEAKTGLKGRVAKALVQVAGETRRLYANGELAGCIDTASLLNWARKCKRSAAASVHAVMRQGALVWADLVVGRDHTGRLNREALDALQDYLKSLGVLP